MGKKLKWYEIVFYLSVAGVFAYQSIKEDLDSGVNSSPPKLVKESSLPSGQYYLRANSIVCPTEASIQMLVRTNSYDGSGCMQTNKLLTITLKEVHMMSGLREIYYNGAVAWVLGEDMYR